MIYLVPLLLAMQLAPPPTSVPATTHDTIHRAQKVKTMTVEDVLRKHGDAWMEIDGVLGTGEGKYKDKPCITIFVDTLSDKIRKAIPDSVDGFHVNFEQTGPINAQ